MSQTTFAIPFCTERRGDQVQHWRTGCTVEEVALWRALRRTLRLLKKVQAQHRQCELQLCACPDFAHWRWQLARMADDLDNETCSFRHKPVSGGAADTALVVPGKGVS